MDMNKNSMRTRQHDIRCNHIPSTKMPSIALWYAHHPTQLTLQRRSIHHTLKEPHWASVNGYWRWNEEEDGKEDRGDGGQNAEWHRFICDGHWREEKEERRKEEERGKKKKKGWGRKEENGMKKERRKRSDHVYSIPRGHIPGRDAHCKHISRSYLTSCIWLILI